MRKRSDSSVKLDQYRRLIHETLLKTQNPLTGLIPANSSQPDAWVRDNVYASLAVWGLSMAYRKSLDTDEGRSRAFELEQSVVRVMRGVLQCFMRQKEKVEKFKVSQNRIDSLHAKFSSVDFSTVVSDSGWGHLQLDAVSLFLLILAEMTAAGLTLIQSLDEVTFIQNLVFYIETAYRIPDYGIWERGDKTNHGVLELNVSSIGLAKAALQAMDGLNMFGAGGGSASLIHTMPDEAVACHAVVHCMLPRESNSKETDSALMSVISYPAWAVDDKPLAEATRNEIISKLQGTKYGCKRFLRDGYKNAKEDHNRLHYESWELQMFENLECEWPLFYTYLALDALFNKKPDIARDYISRLDALVIRTPDGRKALPQLYQVPKDRIDAELAEPGTQDRVPLGQLPHCWTQSLYLLAKLLEDNLIQPGELDPLNRRLVSQPKPDLVTQIVLLAEDDDIKHRLSGLGIDIQTVREVSPIHVHKAHVLNYLYGHLGKNKRLGLSGRASSEIGLLATSKLYRLHDDVFVFTPSFLDQQVFYLGLDSELLADILATNIAYLNQSWNMIGRPTMTVVLTHWLLDQDEASTQTHIATLKNLQSGLINGHLVQVGSLNEFIPTSCVSRLSFLEESEDFSPIHTENLQRFLHLHSTGTHKMHRLSHSSYDNTNRRQSVSLSRVAGLAKRDRTIITTPTDKGNPLADARLSDLFEEGSEYSIPASPDSRDRVESFSSEDLNFDEDMEAGAPGIRVWPSTSRKATHSAALKRTGTLVPLGSLSDTHLLHMPTAKSTPLLDIKFAAGMKDNSPTNSIPKRFSSQDLFHHINILRDSANIQEQGDIIHYMYMKHGLDYDTCMGGRPGSTVKELLVELNERAGQLREWWLVRQTAGILRRRPDDLAKVLLDLLVRGKQVTIGLPPEPQEKVISRPLPPDEVEGIVREACAGDASMVTLTFELLVYLAMLIKTDTKLFVQMSRIRVGLIIQVMTTELEKMLESDAQEATDTLLNLSPYQMKCFLYGLLSGTEFSIGQLVGGVKFAVGEIMTSGHRSKKSVRVAAEELRAEEEAVESPEKTEAEERRGQWVRRRRLDASLNRVPAGFYTGVWKLLKRCGGMTLYGNHLRRQLTQEMTQHEMKFAITVENTLNLIPAPTYRQLFVEAVMVLTLLVENDCNRCSTSDPLDLDHIIHVANDIFLDDQRDIGGVACACCALPHNHHRPTPLACNGANGICMHFFDSAPSGRFGTMTYLGKAVARVFHIPTTQDGDTIDCCVS